jgi:predicted ribosome quality control (RQC) complex YloA/Tae2 family protein
MRILLYYSNKDSYEEALIALSVNQNNVSLRWADNFKEAHLDRCDEVYIMYDIEDKQKERISKHYTETMKVDVFLIPEAGEGAQVPTAEGELQFETLEDVEAYISELQLELENAQEIRNAFLEAAKQSAEQKQREEDARVAKEKAEQEAKEADDALAKAEKEKQEADDAAKAALEAEALANQGAQETETDATSETTDDKYEHPTREQMILELRGLKDEGIEVPIPRNATLAQIKPLYDEHIRKINGDA